MEYILDKFTDTSKEEGIINDLRKICKDIFALKIKSNQEIEIEARGDRVLLIFF
jgi:hypothetical protein